MKKAGTIFLGIILPGGLLVLAIWFLFFRKSAFAGGAGTAGNFGGGFAGLTGGAAGGGGGLRAGTPAPGQMPGGFGGGFGGGDNGLGAALGGLSKAIGNSPAFGTAVGGLVGGLVGGIGSLFSGWGGSSKTPSQIAAENAIPAVQSFQAEQPQSAFDLINPANFAGLSGFDLGGYSQNGGTSDFSASDWNNAFYGDTSFLDTPATTFDFGSGGNSSFDSGFWGGGSDFSWF